MNLEASLAIHIQQGFNSKLHFERKEITLF